MISLLFFTIGLTTLLTFLFYYLDSREKEPIKYILLALFYGFGIAILELTIFRLALLKLFFGNNLLKFTLLLNDEIDNPELGLAFFSAIIIGGFLKEGLKIFAFAQLVRRIKHEIDEPFDSIVYAVMVSLGFQLFENLLFIRTEFVTANFIGVIGLINHLICGIIMGYLHQRYFFANDGKSRFLFGSIIIQMGIHCLLRLCFVWNNVLGYAFGGLFLIIGIALVSNLLVKTMREGFFWKVK